MAVTDPDSGDRGESGGEAASRLPARRGDARVLPLGGNPVRAAAGIVQVAASAVTEAAGWGVDTALEVTGTVVRGSLAGRPPREVLSEAGEQLRDSLRKALGVPTGVPRALPEAPTLRQQGAELLRLSARVDTDPDEEHPAYGRMLTELLPDEARVLRLLYLDGAQPALDIRTRRPLRSGVTRGEFGFTLLAVDAALAQPERVDPYLTNLGRLGLITVVPDPLDNPVRYQLLESQPEVRKILQQTGFGTKVRYRSIGLTKFGTDFVRRCLPVL
ncbi:Abi-alpha family protein [Nocardia sp. alder85J]|uniref:Abi-alpha family protein n=1 Tax=Nocardia sp. alder85J TaxID=2862949 RepID=UPI001CD1BAB2|nr:Abi-alpha family protein [Nocardia sp. alder85J]MCX4097170.1 Abi-alpha family protein [Nocardia sp. alder85J]